MHHAQRRLDHAIRCQEVDAPEPFRLWCVPLDRQPSAVELAWLSADEHRRARGFAFEQDRRRYQAAHVALRAVLADWLGVEPHALAFDTGAFGKPRVRSSSLQFNLSHSENLAVIVLASGGGVGVDVEVLRPISDLRELAQAHFTADEQRQVLSLDGADATRAFLTCWARKEACLKAVGWGLGVEPATIEVGAHSDPVEVPVRNGGHGARVVVRSLPPVHGAVVALAQAE